MSAPTAVVVDLSGVIACAQSPAGRAEILAAMDVPAGRAEEFWRACWELRQSYDGGRLSGARRDVGARPGLWPRLVSWWTGWSELKDVSHVGPGPSPVCRFKHGGVFAGSGLGRI